MGVGVEAGEKEGEGVKVSKRGTIRGGGIEEEREERERKTRGRENVLWEITKQKMSSSLWHFYVYKTVHHAV